jgi:hypothetical protein
LAANIRSDNRVPFASAHALFNLSKLAVWWLRLGIERIKPGHPQQNGRHERMHLTLQKETAKPAGLNFLQQQARFDEFIEIFNEERTHEALDMKCRAEVYQPATRTYTGLPDIDYPFHDKIIVVTRCRRICLGRKKINFSTVFAAKPWASKKFTTISGWSALWIMIWGLRSRHSSAGTARESVRPEVVTLVAGAFRYPCVRVGPRTVGGPARIRTWDQRIMSPLL